MKTNRILIENAKINNARSYTCLLCSSRLAIRTFQAPHRGYQRTQNSVRSFGASSNTLRSPPPSAATAPESADNTQRDGPPVRFNYAFSERDSRSKRPARGLSRNDATDDDVPNTRKWAALQYRTDVPKSSRHDNVSRATTKSRSDFVSFRKTSPNHEPTSDTQRYHLDRNRDELFQVPQYTPQEQAEGSYLRDFRITTDKEDVGRSESVKKQKPQNKTRQRRRSTAGREESEGFDFDDEVYESKKQKKEARRRELEGRKAAEPTPIELPPFISVVNLATALRVKADVFVKRLEELGFEGVAMDHVLSAEDAGLVASEFNFQAVVSQEVTNDLYPQQESEDTSLLPPRPPIVTIMGHVDHGKTTILDYLRKTSVAATEHGGITQHIGAFSVALASSGKTITFLDTPGHAAFLSMRQRGANVTDIVVLVVAADDSVKPQTIEAIKHAKEAQVSIIVAMNKVDKPEVDIQRVQQDLFANGIEVESFDGDVQAIAVSGKTGQGMGELEEAIVTLAEVLDLRANPNGLVEGWVLEATKKSAGRVATVLVRRGTLRVGDVVVAGTTWARVRTIHDAGGVALEQAGPGTPVEITGWRVQPSAGDEVLQVPQNSEQRASATIDYRIEQRDRRQAAVDMDVINASRKEESQRRHRENKIVEDARLNAHAQGRFFEVKQAMRLARERFAETEEQAKREALGGNVDLYLVVKADVSGSAEAIATAIDNIPLGNQRITIHILSTSFGPVNENDVIRAASVPEGRARLVNFNQRIPTDVMQMAAQADVRILDSNIIYNTIDGIREFIETHLPPVITQTVTGEAEIAQIFDIRDTNKKMVKVAGCRIRNGILQRSSKVKVYRGGSISPDTLIYTGTLASLRSHKKIVDEMRKGSECGIGFANEWDGFKVGDVVQCFEEFSERRRLTGAA